MVTLCVSVSGLITTRRNYLYINQIHLLVAISINEPRWRRRRRRISGAKAQIRRNEEEEERSCRLSNITLFFCYTHPNALLMPI